MIIVLRKMIKVDEYILDRMIGRIGGETNESGGLIGSSIDGVINEFCYDAGIDSNGDEYFPDVEMMQLKLKEWNEHGIQFMGIIHSHKSNESLSGKDIYMGQKILALNPSMKSILMPVLVLDDQRVCWYSIERDHNKVCEIETIIN